MNYEIILNTVNLKFLIVSNYQSLIIINVKNVLITIMLKITLSIVKNKYSIVKNELHHIEIIALSVYKIMN